MCFVLKENVVFRCKALRDFLEDLRFSLPILCLMVTLYFGILYNKNK